MVILDPGHGFDTPGKRSPVWSDGTQLLEWEFSRDVVRRIERRLIALNIPCQILVRGGQGREQYAKGLNEQMRFTGYTLTHSGYPFTATPHLKHNGTRRRMGSMDISERNGAIRLPPLSTIRQRS